MFALIETNGATHIAINIPLEGAEKTLPALAAMLENNAVFIRKDYNTCETVTPKMGITLGDTLKLEGYEIELKIQKSGAIIDESFVIESPEVRVSNAKGLKTKNELIAKQATEIAFLKSELASLQARFAELPPAPMPE